MLQLRVSSVIPLIDYHARWGPVGPKVPLELEEDENADLVRCRLDALGAIPCSRDSHVR
jgi:hypothetical protein